MQALFATELGLVVGSGYRTMRCCRNDIMIAKILVVGKIFGWLREHWCLFIPGLS